MTMTIEEFFKTLTNGSIFEFENMGQAKLFAVAVKQRFDLDSRVFDDSEAAERVHAYPFGQRAPVVHVDRPYWSLPDKSEPGWKAAFAKEPKIIALAKQFGGAFVGT